MEDQANGLLHLRLSVDTRVDGWMEWAQTQKEDITEDVVDLEFEEGSSDVKELCSIVYSKSMMCCSEIAVSTIGEVKHGNGQEATRKLMRRFEPRPTSPQELTSKPSS